MCVALTLREIYAKVSKGGINNYITCLRENYHDLSYEVASGSEITPCNKID